MNVEKRNRFVDKTNEFNAWHFLKNGNKVYLDRSPSGKLEGLIPFTTPVPTNSDYKTAFILKPKVKK